MLRNRDTYWQLIWRQFRKRPLGMVSLYVVLFFCLVAIYAPFLAASKPLVVHYQGEWFFPLFRYLFYRGYYTKGIDLFFNLLIFTLPLGVMIAYLLRYYFKWLLVFLTLLIGLHVLLFISFLYGGIISNPSFNFSLSQEKYQQRQEYPNWERDLSYMTPYAKLNLVLRYQQFLLQHQRVERYASSYRQQVEKQSLFTGFPTLWQTERDNEEREIARQTDVLKKNSEDSKAYKKAKASIAFIIDRRRWIEEQLPYLKDEIMPLIRDFHWEDDAGGNQYLNHYVSLWDLTRVNRKDLVAALIFGTRISLVVGLLAVSLAVIIGLPIGIVAGFYGGKFDILVSRLLEIWEGMPTFFMLLLVVAILQNKSIFLVILVIGVFGWTTFSRYIRGEFFKQRNLPYTEACRALGLSNRRIMFAHILPNALPPVLTLLPFAIMGAITSEAGLSFLGLGEEGSCSWGVLMDEGRSVFPDESYLLWPPAILLTILLIAIALIGDAWRDALDPKMHRDLTS